MNAVILPMPTPKAIETMSEEELHVAFRAAERRLAANPTERNTQVLRAIADEQSLRRAAPALI